MACEINIISGDDADKLVAEAVKAERDRIMTVLLSRVIVLNPPVACCSLDELRALLAPDATWAGETT